MEKIDEMISYICDWLQINNDSVGAPEMGKALAELISAKAKINTALRSCQGKNVNHQQEM